MTLSKSMRIFAGVIVALVSFFFLSFFFSMRDVFENGMQGYIEGLKYMLVIKLLVSFLLGFLVYFLWHNTLNDIKSQPVGDNQHGSARWMTEKEMRSSYTYVLDGREKKPGFIVGRAGNEWIIDMSDKTICLIAPPGGGKTKSIFIPTLYYNAAVQENTGKGASILSIDVKSENFKTSGNRLKEAGYHILHLDFRNPLESYQFNLMNGVNKEIDQFKAAETSDNETKLRHYAKAERYAKQVSSSIVKNIMGESKDSASDFFDKTAQGLITGLILMVSQYGEDNERHIISVFKLIVELNGLIDNGNLETGQQRSKLMELLQFIDDKRITDYVGASVNADVRTSMNIFSSALAKLVEFIDAELEQMICSHSPEINAIDFIENPTAIFLICPDEDNSRHFFASLFIRYFTTQLIDLAEASPGMKLKRQVLCLWDEFGNMPAIKDVDSLFTAARSRGIRFMYSLQSFAQLQKSYNRTYEQIILDASQILIFTFLSPTALDTAKRLSEILGNQTILSGSVSRDYRSGGQLSDRATYQMMKRPLLTPDEIISIPIGNYIILKSGGTTEQIKMRSKLPMYSDYLKVYPEYEQPIQFKMKEIHYLDSEKIRLLGALAKNKLSVGMFD